MLTSLGVFAVTRPPEPERLARAAEERLARGQVVTLVGDDGRSARVRVLTPASTAVAAQRGEPLAVSSSWGLGLVELLVRAPGPRYRLRALVRHDQSAGGDAGLYFAHSLHPTEQGAVHCCFIVSFNDLDDLARRHPELDLAGNLAKLTLFLYRERGAAAGLEQSTIPIGRRTFQPALARPGEGPWRTLTVEATPESFRVFWGADVVADVPRATLPSRAERLARYCPDGHLVRPAFAPEGALGLYVYRGSASFRDVVIEPLPGPHSAP